MGYSGGKGEENIREINKSDPHRESEEGCQSFPLFYVGTGIDYLILGNPYIPQF